jgi:hypothetical protein
MIFHVIKEQLPDGSLKWITRFETRERADREMAQIREENPGAVYIIETIDMER